MDDINKRIKDLEMIISGLEHNQAFNIVVEDKRKTVELCDSNWHRIDLNDKDKLLELKYAKHAAEAVVNTIDIYKNELESLKKQRDEPQGYVDD